MRFSQKTDDLALQQFAFVRSVFSAVAFTNAYQEHDQNLVLTIKHENVLHGTTAFPVYQFTIADFGLGCAFYALTIIERAL